MSPPCRPRQSKPTALGWLFLYPGRSKTFTVENSALEWVLVCGKCDRQRQNLTTFISMTTMSIRTRMRRLVPVHSEPHRAVKHCAWRLYLHNKFFVHGLHLCYASQRREVSDCRIGVLNGPAGALALHGGLRATLLCVPDELVPPVAITSVFEYEDS